MRLGIDFGTTMSESATVIAETPQKMMADYRGPIPSLVHYWEQRDPKYHVGYDVTDSERSDVGLMRDIKMYLGHDISDGNGNRFRADQLAAMIIDQVIDVAKEQAKQKDLNDNIEKLVISVPARFDAAQLQLLRNAVAKVSGISVSNIGLIKEPVAAALYMYEQDVVEYNSKTIFVFDMGGGTLDCTIMKKTDDAAAPYVEVKSDTMNCAGRNFDDAAADLLIANAKKQRIDLSEHESSELMTWGEQLKIQLTNNEEAAVAVQHEGSQYIIGATRREFEQQAKPLLDQAFDFMDNMLAGYGHVDEIICVGGSSSMPMIAKGIHARHPDTPVSVQNPQLAIAYGAALYACEDEGGRARIMLKSPFTYAQRAFEDDGDVEYLYGHVMRGTELPSVSKRTYATRHDDQESVIIRIYAIDDSSDRIRFDSDVHGDPILEVSLDFRTKYPKDTPFDLTLTLDRNGILHAEAQTKMGDFVKAQVNVLDSSSR